MWFENHAAAGLELGANLVLFSCAYTDEATWNEGADDCPRNVAGPRWSRLMVRKEQIADFWPYDSDGDRTAMVTYTTGAPGRQSSIHLIEPEMRPRHARGELAETLKVESEFLSGWRKQNHPKAAPASPKTIRNNLGRVYRSLKLVPK